MQPISISLRRMAGASIRPFSRGNTLISWTNCGYVFAIILRLFFLLLTVVIMPRFIPA